MCAVYTKVGGDPNVAAAQHCSQQLVPKLRTQQTVCTQRSAGAAAGCAAARQFLDGKQGQLRSRIATCQRSAGRCVRTGPAGFARLLALTSDLLCKTLLAFISPCSLPQLCYQDAFNHELNHSIMHHRTKLFNCCQKSGHYIPQCGFLGGLESSSNTEGFVMIRFRVPPPLPPPTHT